MFYKLKQKARRPENEFLTLAEGRYNTKETPKGLKSFDKDHEA